MRTGLTIVADVDAEYDGTGVVEADPTAEASDEVAVSAGADELPYSGGEVSAGAVENVLPR